MGESKIMKIQSILKFLVISFIFSLLLSNFSFADYNYDGEELRGKAQMEKLIEVKRKIGSLYIPTYITQPMDGEGPTEEETQSKEYQEWLQKVERNHGRYQTVNDFISGQEEEYYIEEIVSDDNSNIQQYNDKEVSTTNQTLFKTEFIIILVIIMIVILFLFIIIRKRFLLVIDFIILVLILVSIIFFQIKRNDVLLENYDETMLENIEETKATHIEKVRKWRVKAIDNYDKETKELLDLLSGNKTDKKLEDFAEKYKKENIDIYNENEVDLSRVINDYIIKCYYCVKRKANDKELYSDDIDVLNCFNDPNYNYDVEYYNNDYTSPEELYKYEFKIKNSLLSKESMKGIYDNITEEDLQDYNNGVYLDKLVEKIGLIIKSKEDFDAYSIIPYKYFNITRLDLEPIYKCKYWYLEKGQDTELNLPYGTILKYEVAKYEKRSVEKWYYAEIKKLAYDYDDEKTIFAYYLDDDNNLNGLYTTVYNDEIYNLKELTDEIKYPNIDIYTNTKSNKINSNSIKYDTRGIDRIIYRSSAKVGKRDEEYFSLDFINKYGSMGILLRDDVDSVSNETIKVIDENTRKENKYFCKIDYLGTLKYDYALYKIIWEDDKVDDIEYYIIPEDKMNLSYEEMYQLAFND